MKCLLLDIDMPVGNTCPCPYNEDNLVCQEDCGCADDPVVINAKINNWERFKKEIMKSGKQISGKEVKEVKDTTKMKKKEMKETEK